MNSYLHAHTWNISSKWALIKANSLLQKIIKMIPSDTTDNAAGIFREYHQTPQTEFYYFFFFLLIPSNTTNIVSLFFHMSYSLKSSLTRPQPGLWGIIKKLPHLTHLIRNFKKMIITFSPLFYRKKKNKKKKTKTLPTFQKKKIIKNSHIKLTKLLSPGWVALYLACKRQWPRQSKEAYSGDVS